MNMHPPCMAATGARGKPICLRPPCAGRVSGDDALDMADQNPLPLDLALDLLPQRFPGPGGVAVVLRDGKEAGVRAWGYAGLESHQPMTRRTRLPICSISKQFTCGALLAELGGPEALDPLLSGFLLTLVLHLAAVRVVTRFRERYE